MTPNMNVMQLRKDLARDRKALRAAYQKLIKSGMASLKCGELNKAMVSIIDAAELRGQLQITEDVLLSIDNEIA